LPDLSIYLVSDYKLGYFQAGSVSVRRGKLARSSQQGFAAPDENEFGVHEINYSRITQIGKSRVGTARTAMSQGSSRTILLKDAAIAFRPSRG